MKSKSGAVPKKLYHGTSTDNIDSILKHGLKRGTMKSCTSYSKEQGYIADCMGNVSLAKKEQDAIFFAMTSTIGKREFGSVPNQLIIEVNPEKLEKSKLGVRNLFNKKDSEVKYFGDIPPSAFTKVVIREFYRDKGKLKVRKRNITEG